MGGLVVRASPPIGRISASWAASGPSARLPLVEQHEAIVCGAGPSGLAAAAMLRKRGFETVVLERSDRVAARWRRRYDGLRLNTMRSFSSLPGKRMPRSYGRWPARDDFVAYLEDYAACHQLDIRFGTELQRIDKDGSGWGLETSNGDFKTGYAVVATGYDAVPHLPDWPGRDEFAGELIHAVDYRSPLPYAGRNVLVVGAGNTGIDIAGHLIKTGANVSLAMRMPPSIFPREFLGTPLQPSGILADKVPAGFGDVSGRLIQRLAFGDLSEHGLPVAPEGYQSKFRRTYTGPAVDDGFVAALKAGRTRVVATVERFEAEDVVLADGSREQPDAVICATSGSCLEWRGRSPERRLGSGTAAEGRP